MQKAAWESLLRGVTKSDRAAYAYLLANMPESDLRLLKPERLAENVRIAQAARAAVPWKLPESIYLDAVLPYASVTEPRDPMRREFFDRYLAVAKSSKSPGDAAQRLNRLVFADYKVGYNTRRLRTDQSSRETIAQGMATCTGLSILLIEACRAVGVPARLAGIHSWPGRGGNHTWVEVWDGDWHFVGAAEPDEKGLDHAWFVGDAGTAIKDKPENAVWAVTFGKGDGHFPLAWNPEAVVNAVNVTDRYAAKKEVRAPRLMVEVRLAGERFVASVEAFDAESGERLISGQSCGPTTDVNVHINANAREGAEYWIVVRGPTENRVAKAKISGDTIVRVDLDGSDIDVRKALRSDHRPGAEAARKALESS